MLDSQFGVRWLLMHFSIRLPEELMASFYRWIARGKDLTIFEAVALLIPIPLAFIVNRYRRETARLREY
jgi:hypothetical protein